MVTRHVSRTVGAICCSDNAATIPLAPRTGAHYRCLRYCGQAWRLLIVRWRYTVTLSSLQHADSHSHLAQQAFMATW